LCSTAYAECNLWSSGYDFVFHHALCMLLWNTDWVVRLYVIVTCIFLVALLPEVIDNLHSLILDSLLTSVVFFFQKCLAAIPFTWGKKASWLTQTEQKLSFLLSIAYVLYERNGGKKNTTWRNLGFTGLVVLMGRLRHLSLPSFEFLLCWSSVDSSTTSWLD